MIINATAELYYNQALSTFSGHESLELDVKFKIKGKFLKVKLNESLASSFYYHNSHLITRESRYSTIDDYYNDVEKIINDKEYIERCAVEMVQRYFRKMKKDSSENNRKQSIVKMTKDLPKIEIKVEIK